MKRENEIIVILGKKGSGKTSLAMNLIRDKRRLVIFDFNREYEGFYVVQTPEQLIEVFRLNFDADFKVCYRPDPLRDIDDHFLYLSGAVFSMHNVTFLCEEVDLVSSAGDMPDGLKKIINYGRHRGINLIALSRRAHKVPRDLTANADRIISFAQFEPRDIRYLAEYMGDKAALKVTTLERTDTGAAFIEWSGGDVSKGNINFVDKSLGKMYPIGTVETPTGDSGKPLQPQPQGGQNAEVN